MPDSRKPPKSSKAAAVSATPQDDRKLAHPHREGQAMAVAASAAPGVESSAFGLAAIQDAPGAGAVLDVAFDTGEGRGVGMVRLTDAGVMPTRKPVLSPDASAAVFRRGAAAEEEPAHSGSGYGFVINAASLHTDEGEEGAKGGAVFGGD